MQENSELKEEKDDFDVHHGSDKGFKTVMKRKESVLEYLRVFFPKLFVLLDTDNFELDNTNYIKENFDEFYSDVVYRTYLKEPPSTDKTLKGRSKKLRKAISVVLLFEHKKSIESYFCFYCNC
jgi:hypothetical protein